MVCIQCGQNTHVINSRHQIRANQVWRRRKCQSCGTVFSTEETASYQGSWIVRNAQGHVEPFSRDKLLLSLHRSCEHRKTALKDAGALSETIISKLSAATQDGVLESRQIVSAAQVALNRFDKAAGVHYAAFHAS
jgi:transcriptional repressor NrdR